MMTFSSIGNLPSTFWTNERMSEFWGYVRWFISYNMKPAMIVLAVFVAYMVITMIVNVVYDGKNANAPNDRNDRKDDDDGYDVRYY